VLRELLRRRTDILAIVIIAEIDSRLDAELMGLRDVLRARWREVELKPPDVVYHYTDLKGFAGILSSGTMWATLSSKLNDEMELRHASAELRRVLRAEAAAAYPMFRHMLLPPEALNFEYARQDAIEVFVASLSSHPDHPRQWCMYAREGCGVALGFRTRDLLAFELLESRVPYFAMDKVIYDAAVQREFLTWVARYWFDRTRKIFPGLALRSKDLAELTYLRASMLGTLGGAVAGYLPLMKSQAWAAESEWRLGHAQDPNNPHGFVRYRGSSRIPFVPLDIRGDNGLLPLAEIVIGPAFAREESATAVEHFLRLHGYPTVNVRTSEEQSAGARVINLSDGRPTSR
jgi:hypothetical protein